MAKLKIKNVGPIITTDNLAGGYIEFKGVTVFIGSQGTGKSTIAKIFSTLSWIEKALIREDFIPEYLDEDKHFINHMSFQNIGNYLNKDSYIEYVGDAYTIIYEGGKVNATKSATNTTQYSFPKIMYVPAERNFLSAMERPEFIKRLPSPLYSFLEEFDNAKYDLKGQIALPVGDLKFEFIKETKESLLIGKNYSIKLTEASSGYLSLVPLFLVTQNLSKLTTNENNSSIKNQSLEVEKKIRVVMGELLSEGKHPEGIEFRVLRDALSNYNYSCFINIVEEPEQNLYPSSQKEILFFLLMCNNLTTQNKLVMTTHSPYMINHLTLAIKGYILKEKTNTSPPEEKELLLAELVQIVPSNSFVNPTTINIYEISESGVVIKLENYHDLPSDENLLNDALGEFNDDFDKLLEIEDKCR